MYPYAKEFSFHKSRETNQMTIVFFHYKKFRLLQRKFYESKIIETYLYFQSLYIFI